MLKPTNPWSLRKRVGLAVICFLILLVALVFLDVVPIGYKHVTIPQDVAYNGTLEARRGPTFTCPPVSQPAIKLHWHKKGELQLYNEPVRSSPCPTYTYTDLLYW